MKKKVTNIKFLSKYIKGSKYLLIWNTILNILVIILSVIMPILSAKVIVNLTNNELHSVIMVSILLFSLRIINIIFNFFVYYTNALFYVNFYSKLTKDINRRLHTFTNKVLDNNSTGLFIKRLKNDPDTVAITYWNVSECIYNMLSTVGVFIAMFIISPIVCLFTLIGLALVTLLDNYNVYKSGNLKKITKKEMETSAGLTSEVIHGIRDIKMLNVEKNTEKLLKDEIEKVIKCETKEKITNHFIGNIANITDNLRSLLTIILFIYLITNDKLTIVNALVLFNYNTSISYFQGYVGVLLSYIKDFNISTGRIKELFDNEKFDVETFGTKHIKKVKGKFEFKDVYFGYKDNEVLKGVSFTVNPDETVAFVGKTGSGKTTIFNLLCKMYEVNSGEILIDNININELDKDTIRGNITVISQSPYIFNMSIKDNLKLVKPNITNKEMKEALKTACLYDYVESLPDKYDTILGEGGVTLSGGQKQRLAIARALIQKTEIILFDEATSALDNETQEKITKAINNMKREYTIMIIAHRLSTIINADKIFFLNNGVIECFGSHEYLLKHSKDYKKLYELEIKKENMKGK